MSNISYTICSLSFMQSRLYFDLFDGEDQGVRVYTNSIAILVSQLFQKTEKIMLGSCLVYVNKKSFADWFVKTLVHKKLDQTSVNEGTIEEKIIWLYSKYIHKEKLVLTNFSSSDESLKESPFYFVPREIFLLISSYLNVKEVNTLGTSCKRFNVLTSDNTLWKKIYLQRFPFTKETEDLGVNWKKKYILEVYPWKQKPTLNRIDHVLGYSQQDGKTFFLSRKLTSLPIIGHVYLRQTVNCVTHQINPIEIVSYSNKFQLYAGREKERKIAQSVHPDSDLSDLKILVEYGLSEKEIAGYDVYRNMKFLAVKNMVDFKAFDFIQILDLKTRQWIVNLKIREDSELFVSVKFKLFESLLVVFNQTKLKIYNLSSPSFSLIFKLELQIPSIIEVAGDERHLAIVTPKTLLVYDIGLKKQIHQEDLPNEGILIKQIDVVGNQIVATFQHKHVLYIWKFPNLAINL